MKNKPIILTAMCLLVSTSLFCCAKKEPPKEIVTKPSAQEQSEENKTVFIACKLNKDIKKGEQIQKDDFDFVKLKWSEVPYGTVYSSLGVNEGITTKDLTKGSIIKNKDIEKLPIGARYMMHGTMRAVSP